MAAPDDRVSAWIGPGISYRRPYHQALLQLTGAERSTATGRLVLEIIPDHFFTQPEALATLAERFDIVFHDVGVSLATVGQDTARRQRLRQIRTLVEVAHPVLFSDHLAMTVSPEGLDGGHLVPAWYTEAVLAQVVQHVQQCQDVLGLPCAVENIAAPFLLPAPLSEAAFFTQLVARTGCGLLLDLANLLCNARNFHHDAASLLAQYPLAAVQQIHLAGGLVHQGWWVDSHSTPVEEASLALLEGLNVCPRLRTVVVERDQHLPPLATLLDEAQQAAQRWLRGQEGALR